MWGHFKHGILKAVCAGRRGGGEVKEIDGGGKKR